MLALTAFGFTLAAVYGFAGARELVLVAVLINTTLTLFLLAAFGALPARALRTEALEERRRSIQRRRHRVIGAVSGAMAFVVAWSALSSRARGGVAGDYIELSGSVHAADPVAAILADFRGLDTAGEASVLVVAMLGIATLVRWRRIR